MIIMIMIVMMMIIMIMIIIMMIIMIMIIFDNVLTYFWHAHRIPPSGQNVLFLA